MPYCTSCGNTVQPADTYCARCGGRQPKAAPVDPLSGISPRTASLLCYIPVLGWIAAIVVLASSKFRRDLSVRFNAFQGLYLFVAWLIVDQTLGWFFAVPFSSSPLRHLIPDLLKLAIFCAWIFMIVKVSHDEHYKLPIVGDLAEKSLSEQR
jgi:uncharacterized membrane protein